MAPSRTILTSTFVASIGIILLLMSPLFMANLVESGELDEFLTVGGTSQSELAGLEETGDLGFVELPENTPNAFQRGDFEHSCRDSSIPATIAEVTNGIVTNTTTNLSFFGDSYGAVVVDLRGKVPDANRHAFPDSEGFLPGGTDTCHITFYMNVTRSDIEDGERFRFVLHEDTPRTYDFVSMWAQQRLPLGGLTDEVLIDHTTDDYQTGTLMEIPITTIDSLLVAGTFPENVPAGEDFVLKLNLVGTFDDVPVEGDLLVYDWEITKSRDGLLDNENKLIFFNIGYVLIGGLLLVIASPWVAWTDLFGGRSARRDRRGQSNTLGAIVIIGIALIAAMFIFAGGRLSGFFTTSLLPLSLAVLGVSLVAMTSPGKSRPGLTLFLALTAGVIGWSVGVALQANWLPYDKLYVVPFVEVASGQVSGISAFALSAFFVVLVQILGTLLAGFNATQTIATDEVVSLAQ